MNFPSFPSALLKHFPSSLAGLVLVTCLSACDTVTTTQYEATVPDYLYLAGGVRDFSL
uniref:Uncharacterized protein n=1 Tax=Desertifilum tharense IPPAS B-1220 TaxID=1781255 RepID=A0ACD5GRT6_9CYAN